MSGDIILETEDLTKEFAGFVAVNGVTLRVARGTIHALIGPNGARQDHLLQPADQVPAADRGRIAFKGRTSRRIRRRDARLGLVRSFQISRCFRISPAARTCASLAAQARRLVRLLALRTRARPASTIARCHCSRDVGSCDYAESTAVELPYGRKRALELATTIALDPEMLLLDEPTAGMGHEDIERISAADQVGRGRPHGADGRAQSQRRLESCRTASRC
jgi:branched-chain amino acid transport system ATP-binding protein